MSDLATTKSSGQSGSAGSDPRYPGFEREARILGFHPMRAVDDLINAVNDHACNAVDAVEGFLAQDEATVLAAAGRKESSKSGKESSKSGQESSKSGKESSKDAQVGQKRTAEESGLAEDRERGRKIIRESCDAVLRAMQGDIDKAMDRLEVYLMRNVFCLPPDVVTDESDGPLGKLPEDTPPAEEEKAVDEALFATWRKLRETRAFEDALLDEEAELDAQIAALDNAQQELDMASSMKAPADYSIETTLEQAMAAATELAPCYRADVNDLSVAAESAKTSSSIASTSTNTSTRPVTSVDALRSFAASVPI